MKPKFDLKLNNLSNNDSQKDNQKVFEKFTPIINELKIDPSNLKKIDEIGRGSQAIVYRAMLKPYKQIFALKELQIYEVEEQKHLKNELDILRTCDHVNLVRFYGINLLPDKVQILIEYMNCGRLSFLVDTWGGLNECIVGIIGSQILNGLDYLHKEKEKIIHRDLKPSNILINDEGIVKISDFGISRKVVGTDGKMDTYIGTKLYMSPERLLPGNTYTSKCDIWSFGLILYECAIGKSPFKDQIKQNGVLDYEFGDFLINRMKLNFPSEFSQDFKDFLSACLQVKPEKRAKVSELMSMSFMIKSKKIDLKFFRDFLKITMQKIEVKYPNRSGEFDSLSGEMFK